MEHILELTDEVMSEVSGLILVVNNCRIHKRHEDVLRRACQMHGGDLLFLAPYCHDSPSSRSASTRSRHSGMHSKRQF